ncbi:unnamed protein product [Nezara viridula]|uniref:Uncharacterized protein n=1 Tax=Nezara viridula TaxID=85310 RepID=A0A9P0EBA2_NEZVI|nr:unnamed protein product [Nezara viridula]
MLKVNKIKMEATNMHKLLLLLKKRLVDKKLTTILSEGIDCSRTGEAYPNSCSVKRTRGPLTFQYALLIFELS